MGIDLSDLVRVINQFEEQCTVNNMVKNCDYCGKRMDKEILSEEMLFKCHNCGFEASIQRTVR